MLEDIFCTRVHLANKRVNRCELWAPWSEESGRKWSLQWSLGLVNIWQFPQVFVMSICLPSQANVVAGVVLTCRILGGLSSAGGSVTLGVVADMVSTT
jgi:hypothetical protein